MRRQRGMLCFPRVDRAITRYRKWRKGCCDFHTHDRNSHREDRGPCRNR